MDCNNPLGIVPTYGVQTTYDPRPEAELMDVDNEFWALVAPLVHEQDDRPRVPSGMAVFAVFLLPLASVLGVWCVVALLIWVL